VNLPATARGEFIELGLAVVLGDAPPRLDPAAVLEPKEGGIERALIQVEKTLRHLKDSLGQSKPVLGTQDVQRPQHHEIERALQDFFWHSRGECLGSFRMSTEVLGALLEVPGAGARNAVALLEVLELTLEVLERCSKC
jgi:hypothetical protein